MNIEKKLGRPRKYGTLTTTIRIPENRKRGILLYLKHIPEDVDNLLEFLEMKIKETETTLEVLKTQIKNKN